MLRVPPNWLTSGHQRPGRHFRCGVVRWGVVLGILALLGVASPSVAEPADSAPRTETPSGLPVPRFVSIKSPRANVRQGPSPTHAVMWVYVKRGIPVEIVAETTTWRRIRDIEGKEGWVHANMLDGARTAIVTGKTLVPLRRKPGEAAEASAWAEPGLIAKLLACNANWCQISAQHAKGWLPREAIWGVLPGETFE